MRVLICGSRDWKDEHAIGSVLEGLYTSAVQFFEDLTIIEGCSRGADWFAHHFFDGPCEGGHASDNKVKHEHFPADWKTHGKAAGPFRNQQMLEEGKPDVVWAFKDRFDWHFVLFGKPGAGFESSSHGTEDMVRRAKPAGVPIYVVSRA